MVPSDVLLNHVAALLVVVAVALTAGVPACAALRVRLGVPGYLLLGMVYWAVALYAFPFDGGLGLAAAVAVSGFVATLLVRRDPFRRPRPGRRRAAVVLSVGCAAYATLLLRNHVPIGADAGMVGASARLIALHGGLPADYGPWFPDLYFPAVNLCVPTVGAVAIAVGCEPASVVLSLAVLSYSAWILATYSVLCLFARPSTAAVLAVAQAWGSRWAQNTIGWGGFPTVAGMAVGLFAARLMWDAGRRCTARSAVALGVTAGAVPLVHGVSAAVWVYAVAPVLGAALLARSPRPGRTAAALAGGAAVSAAVLACYLSAGQVYMSPAEIEWSREHLRSDAPQPGPVADALVASLAYMKQYGGGTVAWVGAASGAALLGLGAWRRAAGVAACLASLAVVLSNAHWWVLPFSMMLYPDRAVYWAGPLAAVAAAMAATALRRRSPRVLTNPAALAVGLVVLAFIGAQHVNQYQHNVWNPAVGRDGWEALRWARSNLAEPGTFIEATYGSVGSFLPLCAGVPTNAWQVNHCAMEESKAVLARRRPTHRMYVRGVDPDPPPAAKVVFRNESVVIVDVR